MTKIGIDDSGEDHGVFCLGLMNINFNISQVQSVCIDQLSYNHGNQLQPSQKLSWMLLIQ
jgi:hypothetical protein